MRAASWIVVIASLAAIIYHLSGHWLADMPAQNTWNEQVAGTAAPVSKTDQKTGHQKKDQACSKDQSDDSQDASGTSTDQDAAGTAPDLAGHPAATATTGTEGDCKPHS